MLAEDVGFWSDGGGKVLAARRPVFGRDDVVQVLVGIRRTAPSVGIALDRVALDIVEVNDEPALVLRVAGRARFGLHDDDRGRRDRRDPHRAQSGQAAVPRAPAVE